MVSRDHAVDVLRKAKLRLTPQRRALIDALAGDRSHPSADEIAGRLHERMPGISLTTVYKTLHEFAALGLVRELELPGALRFDPDTSAHAHLVCSACGTVVDVPLSGPVADGLALPDGARLDRVDVTLHGACPGCAA